MPQRVSTVPDCGSFAPLSHRAPPRAGRYRVPPCFSSASKPPGDPCPPALRSASASQGYLLSPPLVDLARATNPSTQGAPASSNRASTVTITTTFQRPRPQAMPSAAVTQTVAAVVKPSTV